MPWSVAQMYRSLFVHDGVHDVNGTFSCTLDAMTRMSLEARFLSRVKQGNDCWIWNGSKVKAGYGHLKVNGRIAMAHRVSYELFVAPIPEGYVVHHLCRNTSCVRPEHLRAVTQQQNVHAAINSRATRTHCPKGHPYDAENTYWRPDGQGRGCRTCRSAWRSALG